MIDFRPEKILACIAALLPGPLTSQPSFEDLLLSQAVILCQAEPQDDGLYDRYFFLFSPDGDRVFLSDERAKAEGRKVAKDSVLSEMKGYAIFASGQEMHLMSDWCVFKLNCEDLSKEFNSVLMAMTRDIPETTSDTDAATTLKMLDLIDDLDTERQNHDYLFAKLSTCSEELSTSRKEAQERRERAAELERDLALASNSEQMCSSEKFANFEKLVSLREEVNRLERSRTTLREWVDDLERGVCQ